MKLKGILFALLLIGQSTATLGGYLDDWPDDALCGWMKKPSPPAYIVAEVEKRGLSCEGGKAVGGVPSTKSDNKSLNKNQSKVLVKGSSIIMYEVEFSGSVLKKLLSKVAGKTDYDFSQHKLASNPKDIKCVFNLRRVNYGQSIKGKIENWNLAEGSLVISDGVVSINRGSYWRMGGLSDDKTYLQDQVNLRLTEDGHFVGKMAYFVLNTEPGQVAIKPIYPRIKKHKKSKPLDYKNIKSGAKAEFWIDFEDPDDQWSGGVLYLNKCKAKESSETTVSKVATSSSDPTVSKVIEVIQGDKLIVDIPEPHALAGNSIQLFLKDIDAPDAIKSCPEQMELGVKVKDIVAQMLADATSIKLKNYKKTSRGVVAQVIVDGKDLGKELIAKGYASDEYGYWKGYFCNAMWAINNGDVYVKDREIDKAIFWYERALTLDENIIHRPQVSYALSWLYDQLGEDAKSLEWLTKAANYGWMVAQENLAVRYIEANGVAQDLSEAKYWLKKALLQGSEKAEMLLEEIQ